MAGIKRLVDTSELKTNILRDVQNQITVKYDPQFDALMILLISPKNRTRVHYVDEHVGLLYTPENMEIVGLQVEAFERSFLAGHENIQRVWKLSDAYENLEDVGDIIFVAEKAKSQVAKAVAQVTESMLGEPGRDFSQAVEQACA